MKSYSLGSIERPRKRGVKRTKLNAFDVLNIREAIAQGAQQKEQAYKHRVSIATISRVVNYKSWNASTPNPTPEEEALIDSWCKLKMSCSDLIIRKRFAEADTVVESMQAIERELGFIPE